MSPLPPGACPPPARAGCCWSPAGARARDPCAERREWLGHLDLTCLPASLRLWPDRIPDAAVVGRHRASYDRVFASMPIAAPAGALRRAWRDMVAGPHCHAHCDRLVSLAQTDAPALDRAAGCGDLAPALAAL